MECPKCKGKGWIYRNVSITQDYEPDIEKDICPECNGTKEIEDIDNG